MHHIGSSIGATFLAGWLIAPAGDEALRFAPAEGSSLQKHAHLEVEVQLQSLSMDDYELTGMSWPLVRLVTSARFSDSYARVETNRPLEYLRRFDEVGAYWEWQGDGSRTAIPGFDAWSGAEVSFDWNPDCKEYTRRLEKGTYRCGPALDRIVEDLDLRGLLPEDAVAVGAKWSVRGRPVLDALFGTTDLGLVAIPEEQGFEKLLRDVLFRPFVERGERVLELDCAFKAIEVRDDVRLADIGLRLRDSGSLDITSEVREVLKSAPELSLDLDDFVVDWDLEGQGQLAWNLDAAHFGSLELAVRFRLSFRFRVGVGPHEPGRAIRGTCEGTAKWCLGAQADR
jgi:hypothetical protein